MPFLETMTIDASDLLQLLSERERLRTNLTETQTLCSVQTLKIRALEQELEKVRESIDR